MKLRKFWITLGTLILVVGLVAWHAAGMPFPGKTIPPATHVAPREEAGWIPAHPSDRWTCIVIHHSATEVGGAARFDRAHRDRGFDELGYDFVIGNGSDTADGLIEVGPRWTEQKHGAHCQTPDEYYNDHGIGICLVGNFDNHAPDARQMKSLVKLTRLLCKRFKISPQRIFGHGDVTGKTRCPGEHMDINALRAQVAAK